MKLFAVAVQQSEDEAEMFLFFLFSRLIEKPKQGVTRLIRALGDIGVVSHKSQNYYETMQFMRFVPGVLTSEAID